MSLLRGCRRRRDTMTQGKYHATPLFRSCLTLDTAVFDFSLFFVPFLLCFDPELYFVLSQISFFLLCPLPPPELRNSNLIVSLRGNSKPSQTAAEPMASWRETRDPKPGERGAKRSSHGTVRYGYRSSGFHSTPLQQEKRKKKKRCQKGQCKRVTI